MPGGNVSPGLIQVLTVKGFAMVLQRLYTLTGFIRGKGEQVQYFTQGEKALALHCAKSWYAKGWMPYLYSKTYRGDFKVWFNYRTVKVPATKLRKAA